LFTGLQDGDQYQSTSYKHGPVFRFLQHEITTLYVISGFRRGASEICVLLRFYVAEKGIFLPTWCFSDRASWINCI